MQICLKYAKSDDNKSMKITQSASSLLVKAFEQSNNAASNIASNAENTDLAADFVNLNRASHLTKAAVKTIQTADELAKNIIDLLA